MMLLKIFSNKVIIMEKTRYEHDCEKCQWLCCVVPEINWKEFSFEKEIEVPCRHLEIKDCYKCKIHDVLEDKWLTGCLKFTCNWAWQIVSESYSKSWIYWDKNPESKDEIFNNYSSLKLAHELIKLINENFEKIKTLSQEDRWKLAKMKYKYEKLSFYFENRKVLNLNQWEILADLFEYTLLIWKYKN